MERIEDILDRIKFNDGTFPQKELKKLIDMKEETIPRLLRIMEDVRDNYETYIEERSMLHIYATYLLAEFRITDFFPIFMDIAKLPGELPFDLYGYTVTESFQRIMASVYDGNLDQIHSLIEDMQVNQFVREKGNQALVILVLEDQLERSAVVEYLKNLMLSRGENDIQEFIGSIVYSLTDLYPKDSMEEIKWAIDNNIVPEYMIDIELILQTLKKGEERTLKELKEDRHFQLISSAIKEMHWWACFQKEKKSKISFSKAKQKIDNPYTSSTVIKKDGVGRNEPCPCGSGKKHKKCCG